MSWYPIVRMDKNMRITLAKYCNLPWTLSPQVSWYNESNITKTLIPGKRLVCCYFILTRQSFLWGGGPARWDYPRIGRHSGCLLWFSFHTSLWWWEGRRAPYLLGILLSCRWSFLRTSPCQDKDITQHWLAGGVGVAQGHCAGGANMAAAWQLVKSRRCCFSSSLFFRYLCLKCQHGLVLTEHLWSQQWRQIVGGKNPAYDTKVKVNSIFASGM